VTEPMTERANAWGLLRKLSAMLLGVLALTACQREEEFDYCKHHYQVHAGHAADIARLHGRLSAEGVLTVQVQLPAAVLGSGSVTGSGPLGQLLENADAVYTLQTDQPCSPASVQVQNAAGESSALVLEYRSECGAGNSIRQVDVTLFEILEALEEVEVQMDTPATSKHFAISRLCKQAIFRLKPH